jgi:hypothetical protein
MKKLSTYLFLIFFSFSASSFADDIKDFEIEGISIGYSLLDFMSEEEIKENVVYVYPDKKFTVSVYKKSSKMYNMGVGIEYKSKDKTYKIYGIQGRVSFENNIEGCYKKQDEIEKEISSMFKKSEIKKFGIAPTGDEDKSTYTQTQFYVDSGDALSVACYYYPNTPAGNHLKTGITSKELQNYLISLE